MGSWKLETDVDAGGLPQFLRELALALETGGGAGPLCGLPRASAPGGLRKLVLVAELKAGRQELKLKAKRAGEQLVPAPKAGPEAKPKPQATPQAPGAAKAADASARARDKYRQLKKTLQADFKALHKAIDAGTLPPQDVVESFAALCEAMADMDQPVKGTGGAELAKANAAFLEDARALRRAASARDAGALAEVLSRLDRRKSACHAQFK